MSMGGDVCRLVGRLRAEVVLEVSGALVVARVHIQVDVVLHPGPDSVDRRHLRN